MPDNDNSNGIGIRSFWVSTAQTLGISTVVMCFLFYWAYQTITWEREQMVPTIQGNKAAIDNNTKILEQTNEVIRKTTNSLEKLNVSTQSLEKTNRDSK